MNEAGINQSNNENDCSKHNVHGIDEYLDCSKLLFERRYNNESIEESSLDDFVLHKTIGVGAFGRVLLVNHKSDRETYLAMKVSQFIK